MSEIRATVRLQFHRGFTLDDAVPLVSYFAQLGISHIYASPILKARSGSTHGYDVVDPTCINPELGGDAALQRLVAALRKEGMGLIVDFVPNHMAVGGDTNPWWLDVLEWGVRSPYAQFFDIQWNSPDPLLKGQLLVPFLRTDYGEVLAAGEVTLEFDADNGAFYAQHFSHRFPLYPPSYSELLAVASHETLRTFGRRFEALEKATDYWQAAQALRREFSQVVRAENLLPAITAAIQHFSVAPVTETELADANTATSDLIQQPQLQRLHRLLELQHYRIASWRTAADDINWRRFFDVNDLGALRAERTDVFEAIHAKIFALISAGLIDGLRIDHVDGLANPRAYCRKLRRRVDALSAQRPTPLQGTHFPLYVEKILGDGEQLAQNWTVDGTTGYEFMNQVSLLQHDPLGGLQLYDVWSRISGRSANFKDEIIEARRLVLSSSLAGDFEMVAQGLLLVARTDIATRDVTLGAIRRALFELIVHFPVYRTYAGACRRSQQDQAFFNVALAGARTTLNESDWPLLDHLDQWLGGQPLHELPPGPARKLRRKTLTRFQQLTSPAAAKAVEDTACYRSAVLLSRNDVGFDPYHFSAPTAQFHQHCQTRAASFPHNLLATATHDHKRGEDTRARLAVISERSVWFAEKVEQWQLLARLLKTELDDGIAPSPGDELMLYQILLGSWPTTLDSNDANGINAWLERLLGWQEKALREAKLRSSWSTPNSAYETACREFLTRLLTATDTAELRQDIALAAASLAPAGALNSLVQTLLRMTTPGIPDLYQGSEFWDFSLVDPDNRRPVDFVARVAALAQPVPVAELVANWRDGRIKQHLIQQTLQLRKALHPLFSQGDYQPLPVIGEQAERVIAFIRHQQDDYVLVVAPRLTAGLLGDSTTPHISGTQWGDTEVVLPEALGTADLRSAFSDAVIRPVTGRLKLGEILADFPINILCLNHSG